VTIQDTVPQGSEIPEGLMNNPVHLLYNIRVVFLTTLPPIYDPGCLNQELDLCTALALSLLG